MSASSLLSIADARTATESLDPATNGWLMALAHRGGGRFFRVGAAGPVVALEGVSARLSDPATPTQAGALGTAVADQRLDTAFGPAGAMASFTSALRDAHAWRCTFHGIEMVRADVVSPHAAPGHRRNAADFDVDWQGWLNAFREEAFRDGGHPPPVPRKDLWFWCDDDQPVTMAGLLTYAPHVSRVVTAYTPPELRGRGYSSALISSLAASTPGVVSLNVEVGNTPALRVYARAGFREKSRSEGWVRITADARR